MLNTKMQTGLVHEHVALRMTMDKLQKKLRNAQLEYRCLGGIINFLDPDFQRTGSTKTIAISRRYSIARVQEMAQAAPGPRFEVYDSGWLPSDLNLLDDALWDIGDLVATLLQDHEVYFSRVSRMVKSRCPFLAGKVFELVLISRTVLKHVRPNWKWSVLDTIDSHMAQVHAEAKKLITAPPSRRGKKR
jgi:hypothetical protein